MSGTIFNFHSNSFAFGKTLSLFGSLQNLSSIYIIFLSGLRDSFRGRPAAHNEQEHALRGPPFVEARSDTLVHGREDEAHSASLQNNQRWSQHLRRLLRIPAAAHKTEQLFSHE